MDKSRLAALQKKLCWDRRILHWQIVEAIRKETARTHGDLVYALSVNRDGDILYSHERLGIVVIHPDSSPMQMARAYGVSESAISAWANSLLQEVDPELRERWIDLRDKYTGTDGLTMKELDALIKLCERLLCQ